MSNGNDRQGQDQGWIVVPCSMLPTPATLSSLYLSLYPYAKGSRYVKLFPFGLWMEPRFCFALLSRCKILVQSHLAEKCPTFRRASTLRLASGHPTASPLKYRTLSANQRLADFALKFYSLSLEDSIASSMYIISAVVLANNLEIPYTTLEKRGRFNMRLVMD